MSTRSKEERIKEPVNIDDYKLLAKALKLKIVKQSKIIEDLQQNSKLHLREIQSLRNNNKQLKELSHLSPQPKSKLIQSPGLKSKFRQDRSQIKIDTLLGKKQVMNAFTQNVFNFGISPESVFRIIDIQLSGEIDSDTFRSALSKMALDLNPKEISCLIYIFDENCTGTITRQQYTDALQAYQSSSETGHIYYLSQCLNKLANLLHQSNINISKFYDELQGRAKRAVTLDIFGDQIKSLFSNKILEKEIVGAFNQLDLQKNGFIDRQNFLYGIQSSLNRQHYDQIKKSSEDFPNISQLSNNKKPLKPDNIQSGISKQNTKFFDQIASDLIQQHKESAINIKMPVSQINIQDLFQKYLRDYKLDVNKIYEELTLMPLQKRLTLYSFKKAINQSAQIKASSSEVNPESISSLFKLIDVNQKGSLGISELIYFYLQYGSDLALVFRLIGKYFKNNDLNAEKFFYLYNINSDADISQNRFTEIMFKTFVTTQQNSSAWDKVWKYFDKGRGVQSVAFIISEMKKYQI